MSKDRGGGRVYRPCGRALQLKSDYTLDIFNGDLGTVKAIDHAEQEATLELDDGRMIRYPCTSLYSLTYAYVISIHKSQRAESPAVVIPLVTAPAALLGQTLLYIAFTHARLSVYQETCLYGVSPAWCVQIDVLAGSPVAAPIAPCVALLLRYGALSLRRPSWLEDDPPQDAVAVKHGGDAIIEDHGDILPRVRSADGALVTAELDVAAPVEAAGADLAVGRRGEVDAVGAQKREMQGARRTGSGGVPPCGYYELASGLGILSHTRYHSL